MHHKKSPSAALWQPLTLVVAAFVATTTLASCQAVVSQNKSEFTQTLADESEISRFPDSCSRLGAQTLELPYRPITLNESLRWFVTSTVGPAHIVGVAFVSAGGTAVNRPWEYGSHWTGFGDRIGAGMIGSAVGNGIEIGFGLGLREDPRYFREPQQAFKTRVGHAAKLTFLARTQNEKLQPAYARYLGIVGGNFLSNSWRVHSEANTKDALLRSAEGFAGRMAANAFKEFWPDLMRHLLHNRNRGPLLTVETGINRAR